MDIGTIKAISSDAVEVTAETLIEKKTVYTTQQIDDRIAMLVRELEELKAFRLQASSILATWKDEQLSFIGFLWDMWGVT